MKPIKLTFTGLRSYLTEQTIDLTGKDLMAITGPTGAGKSSVLEAIYFVLYGTATWQGGTGKDLVAEGGTGTLAVEYTFRAQKKTWTIARSVSRNDRPAPVVRLSCADDGTVLTRGVKEKIVSLVGLDRDTFLKSVILPQGRTHELLHMQPAERSGALKQLLGLDRLDRIRELAKERHQRMQPLLIRLQAQRDTLLDDPTQALEEAKGQHAAHTANLKQLKHAQADIGRHRQAQQSLASQHHSLTAVLNLLPGNGAELVARYEKLSTLESELTGQRERQMAVIGKLEQDYHASRPAADTAGDATYNEMVNALTMLTKIDSQLSTMDTRRKQFDEDTHAVADDETALQQLTTTSAKASDAADELKTARDQAEAARKQQQEHFQQHRLALADLRQQQQALDNLEASLRAARQKADTLRDKANELDDDATNAAHKATEADTALQTLQRRHSAAHAAQHSQPGDPCLICDRPLPTTFTRPESPDLDAAQKLAKSTNARARQLATNAAEVKATAEAAADGVVELQQQLDNDTQLAELIESMRTGYGDFNPYDPDLTILTLSTQAAAAANTTSERANNSYTEAHGQATAAKATADTAAAALKGRTNQLEKDRKQLEKLRGKIRQLHDELPARYRLPAFDTDAIIAMKAQVERDRAAADEIRKQQRRQQESIAAEHRNLERLNERIIEEIIQPATELFGQVSLLASRYADLSNLTTDHAQVPVPAGTTIADNHRWATAVRAHAAELSALAQEQAEQLLTQYQLHEDHIAEALNIAGVTGDELDDAITQAAVAQDRAQRNIDRATAQIPQVADLEHRITTCQPHLKALEELAGLLSAGNLIGVLVAKREQDLLGAATILLRQMTKRQFAFSRNFRIYDSHTGQTRAARSLSGGETFIASLALALAVIEVASSGAGRAESLFLDEGFGSLDSESMGQALDALNQQVLSGRFVCLISHMRRVSEHVPHVLLATKPAAGGSFLRWLNDQERHDLADGGNYGGLLW